MSEGRTQHPSGSAETTERRRRVYVALNERGYRIGASHHNSTIPEEVVNAIRDAHEQRGIGYRRLARMFGISRGAVQKICNYSRRAQSVASWRRIR
jgi:DNA invertase Pin-like site-specific DNA recombinase